MGFRGFRLRLRWALAITLISLAVAQPSSAAYIKDYPVTLTQPDGSTVQVLLTGDEYYNWAHDADGYVIVRHPANGRLVYAAEVNGEVSPTDYVVNKVNPRFVGLKPNIAARHASSARSLSPMARELARRSDAPKAHNSGAFNNIVIYIRFSDEQPAAFTHALSLYDTMLNGAAGTNSLRNYYKEVSFNTLTINSLFYPTQTGSTIVSFQDSHPRAYYKPYDATTNPTGYQSDSATREQNLLRAAIAGVKPTIDASGIDTDIDNDGYVDNVVFVVDGDVTAWATLLWPHMWSLGNGPTLGGATVGTYNFQLDNYVFSGGGVGVFCHEMFHSLGAPDLYHYSYDGLSPAGAWDIMEANQEPPQHMTAYMKWKYGTWISSIPEITASGHYTLNPTTSPANNCYKIQSLVSPTQYFVLEYRRKAGIFENSVPGSGLIVSRIDTTAGNGNANGPPDELYIFRPNGTTMVNGDVNSANLSADVGRTALNSTTNPTPFLQNGSPAPLDIHNVTSSGATISFDVTLGYPPATRIGFLTQPGTTEPGGLVSPQPTVAALSDGGIINPNVTGSVTVALKAGTGTAGASLGGTHTLDLVNGRAAFADLTLDLLGSGYVLTASGAGLASGDSTPFDVAYLPQILSIAAQPVAGDAGKPFAAQMVVRVSDTAGHLATSFNGAVSVAIKAGTGTTGAVLSGTTTVNAVAGVATFGNLIIDKAGTGYVLTVSSGSLPAIDSLPVAVTTHTHAIIYVAKDAPGPLHDGLTWGTAFLTVQSGVNAALSGDEVWVAASTAAYVENISLKAGVTVYGGFTGTESARTQRDWKANVTILDGSGNPNSSVVTSTALLVGLDGFTIHNGGGYYPGVYITGGSATIRNCIIRTSATRGVSVSGGTASLANCAFSGNTYGLYVSSATAIVTNCTLSGNTAYGVYVYVGGSATVSNSVVAFNGTGVARFSSSLSVALSHNDVYGNTTANFYGITNPSGTNGNISADPLFTDRPSGDLHLLSGSKCIDAGDDSLVTSGDTDLDGQPRITGLHVDLGAYEFKPIPFTFADAANALRIAGGCSVASSTDQTHLNVNLQSAGLDLSDAVAIARKAAGLDVNP